LSTPGASAAVTVETAAEACLLLANARKAAFSVATQGGLAQGMSLLQDALSLQPLSHDLLSDLAALSLAAGELESARSYAEQALALQPDHGPSLYALGFALSGLGCLRQARQVFIFLGSGDARASLMAEAPDLSPLVLAELARLEAVLASPGLGFRRQG
ncbi:MAG: tetratricopeptide repeat protein, partial [Inhella sp.]